MLTLFKRARSFCEAHHNEDLEWICSRSQLVKDAEDFLEEFVYVIVASGFKGATAARLTPRLVEQDGDLDGLMTVFKNRAKITAIAEMYRRFKHDPDAAASWAAFRSDLLSLGEDHLTTLPRIGPIVKSHLARNIGLRSVAKPDLHMVRTAREYGWGEGRHAVEAMVGWAAGELTMPVGATDFVLWVWLSHSGGTVGKCCDGGYHLR